MKRVEDYTTRRRGSLAEIRGVGCAVEDRGNNKPLSSGIYNNEDDTCLLVLLLLLLLGRHTESPSSSFSEGAQLSPRT